MSSEAEDTLKIVPTGDCSNERIDETKISDDNNNDRVPEKKPENIKELTIKNLDTGEEFVIGENDPDFEFNTFEITYRPFDATEAEVDIDEENDVEKVRKGPESITTPDDKVTQVTFFNV